MGGATSHAVRAVLGCALSTTVEKLLWVVAIVLAGSVAALSGGLVWMLPFVATFAAALLLANILPGYLSSAPSLEETAKVAGTVALPVLITGVVWAGIPALLVGLGSALLSKRVVGVDARMPYARSGVFLVHAISALAPLILFASAASPLALSL